MTAMRRRSLSAGAGSDLGIRGVVFDLDGVLMHSAPCHRAAFQQVFEQLGIDDFQYSPYAGWRTRDVVVDVLHRRGRMASPSEIDAASSKKTHLARQVLDAARPVDPACATVLAELAALYPLGLASSGSRASVLAFLNWTGAGTLFRAVLSGEDAKRGKPDPEIYTRCVEQMGIRPSECLVVEDAVAGVAAARAMGATAVGLSGTVPGCALREAGAAHVLSRLGELPDLLECLQPRQARAELSRWTAVVPAAGRGSRLGFHRAKILYPVAGRLILDWLLDFLEPNFGRMIFVLSPEGVADVTTELNQRIPRRFDVVVQPTPTGMADAVELALPVVRTPHLAVVWGDQVALRRASVQACLRLHEGPLHPDLTFPTVLRSDPYIHFDRDAAGRISGLRQAREGDAMPDHGESDAGLFCFNTVRLAQLLERARASGRASSGRTGEFNLLPLIPLAAREGLVLTPRIMRLEETMGINSAQDAQAVSPFLSKRPVEGKVSWQSRSKATR
jgi:HAD superfamily hydrolase (TIGR01509 family)